MIISGYSVPSEADVFFKWLFYLRLWNCISRPNSSRMIIFEVDLPWQCHNEWKVVCQILQIRFLNESLASFLPLPYHWSRREKTKVAKAWLSSARWLVQNKTEKGCQGVIVIYGMIGSGNDRQRLPRRDLYLRDDWLRIGRTNVAKAWFSSPRWLSRMDRQRLSRRDFHLRDDWSRIGPTEAVKACLSSPRWLVHKRTNWGCHGVSFSSTQSSLLKQNGWSKCLGLNFHCKVEETAVYLKKCEWEHQKRLVG